MRFFLFRVRFRARLALACLRGDYFLANNAIVLKEAFGL